MTGNGLMNASQYLAPGMCKKISNFQKEKFILDTATAQTKGFLMEMDRSLIITMLGIHGIIKDGGTIQDLSGDPNGPDLTKMASVSHRKTGNNFGDWERKAEADIRKTDLPILGGQIIVDDEFWGPYNAKKNMIQYIFTINVLFPLDDEVIFPTVDEANQIREDYGLEPEILLPMPYNGFTTMHTAAAVSKIFWHGAGCSLMRPMEADEIGSHPSFSSSSSGSSSITPSYVADMSHLKDYPTRDKRFRKLGHKVFFDENQDVAYIYDYSTHKAVKPADGNWETTVHAMIQSFAVVVTLREHLIWTHFGVANTLTFAMNMHLKPSHPLRRLLTPFTWRSNTVNFAGLFALVPERGLIHRAIGMSYTNFEHMLGQTIPTCDVWKPFPEWIEENDGRREMATSGQYGYYSDGVKLHDMFKELAQAWMDEAFKNGLNECDPELVTFYNSIKETTSGMAYKLGEFSKTNLVKMLTQYMFVVTAFHELVGTVIDYVIEIDRVSFRASPDATTADLQSWLTGVLLGSTTYLKVPRLFHTFPNWFGQGGAPSWERTIWTDWQVKLATIHSEIETANNRRGAKYKFKPFHPKILATSVSV